MSLTVGQRISGYHVLAVLGRGGMGEVYRAQDVKLGREVALKVLPDGWDDDDDHARRFLREAKTLAGLNHPNIAHVYGFEEHDGRRLLVLELVEGEELAERLQRGPLPLDETRSICRQIAEGLAAAHDHGVVHRDLKPANVRITRGDVAKLLDFGLAKSLSVRRRDGSESTPDPSEAFTTQAGVVVGTPAYMSPERVRGKPDDRRGDIWAFGCVLYECLTGEPAFAGESLPDTLAKIVEHAPDLDALPPATPPELRRLVERCLDKDPRTRLQDVGEARIVLEQATAGTSLEQDDAPVPVAARAPGWLYPLVLGAVIVAAGLAWTLAPRAGEGPGNALTGASFRRLTDFPGTEFGAVLTRDGKFVAFASDRDGPFDTWLGTVGGGTYKNLTTGRRNNWWVHVRDLGFDYAGERIWFVGGNDVPFKSIGILGGEITPYYDSSYVNVDWNSDGTRITYHGWVEGDPLYVADASGDNKIEISIGQEGRHQHFPTWSTDDRWIYLNRGRPSTGEMNLWRVRPEKGAVPEQLTFDLLDVHYPCPIDERTVLFVARDGDGAGPWIWELDVESGEPPRRASIGVEQYTTLSVASDDRSKLAATVANPKARLWSVPIHADGTIAQETEAKRVAAITDQSGRAPRFGGGDLYFLSSRAPARTLWRVRDGEARRIELGDLRISSDAPAASNDGSRVAFVTLDAGRGTLQVLRTDSTRPQALFPELAVHGTMAWSPDGQFLAIGGADAEGDGLFKIRADGTGTPVALARGDALDPVWSPDGELILFRGPQSRGGIHPVAMIRPDGTARDDIGPIILTAGRGARFRFLDDHRIVYMKGFTPGQDFWECDLRTGEERQLTHLSKVSTMHTFDIAPDGNHIVFDRVEPNSDIVLIELRGHGGRARER